MKVDPHSDLHPQADDSTPSTPSFCLADLAPLALLVAALVALFWKVIFTPYLLFYRDVYNYTYPTVSYIHELCRQGALPYWNPYLNYGQPILENPNLLFFYPYTLFPILLPVDLAYTLHFVLHFALAGAGTYLLARRWGQSRVAGFFAAFVFAFSGPVLSLGNVYNHAACAAWIPWALLMTDRAMEGRSRRPWILLTLIFSLQFLAGEPFTLLATFGLCVAYALYRGGTVRRLWAAPNRRIIAGFLLAGCLMVALCAVQFLPAASFLSESRRGSQGLRYRETANWAVHPLSLVELAVPDFYGSDLASPTAWTWVMGDQNVPYFQSIFVGFVPLFLALAGWTLRSDRRRNFVAGAGLVFLLLSFGHFAPFLALAYLLVPLLMLVRYPVKLLVLVVFLVALLAGWGLDTLRGESSRWKARRNRLLLPLEILLACVAVAWVISAVAPGVIAAPVRWALRADGQTSKTAAEMADYLLLMLRLSLPGVAGFTLGGLVCLVGLEQKKRWAPPGLIAFALLGLAQLPQVNYKANPTVPKGFYTYRPPVLSRFNDPPDSYRVTSIPHSPVNPAAGKVDLQSFVNFQSIPEVAGLPPLAQGAFQDRLLLATGSMLFKVEGSINLDIERSLPPYVYDLEIYLNKQAPDDLHRDCLLGRTNVKYLIKPERLESPVARPEGEVFNGSPKPSYLYEDLCFAPRAYVAGSSLFTLSSLDTLRRLASPDFDAQGTVILAAEPGAAPTLQTSEPAGQVEIIERHPNAVRLRAQLPRPGYVLLLERYDPNWHANVDGREAHVWRANQLFRAVYAEAGQHEVYFYYRQRGLKAGLAVSLATAFLLAILYFKR